MKYAEQANGSYGDDASLDGIEEEDGFGLPGQSAIGTVGVNTGGPGGSDVNFNAGEDSRMVNLQPPDPETPFELLDFRDGFGGNKMSLATRTAFVMENGEPLCNHCSTHYLPRTLGPKMACTNCGCLKPNDDHGVTAANFEHVEGPTAGDLAGDEIVKEEIKTGSVDEYLNIFHKTSNDSKLYYQGYNDAMAGKPLDEDLSLLSDDYYNGYEQYKFYNKSPQQSAGPGQTNDLRGDNTNQCANCGCSNHDGKCANCGCTKPSKRNPQDAGPLQLTARKFASIYPIDVIQKFFEV